MATIIRPQTASPTRTPQRPKSSYSNHSAHSTIRRVTPSPESLYAALDRGSALAGTPLYEAGGYRPTGAGSVYYTDPQAYSPSPYIPPLPFLSPASSKPVPRQDINNGKRNPKHQNISHLYTSFPPSTPHNPYAPLTTTTTTTPSRIPRLTKSRYTSAHPPLARTIVSAIPSPHYTPNSLTTGKPSCESKPSSRSLLPRPHFPHHTRAVPRRHLSSPKRTMDTTMDIPSDAAVRTIAAARMGTWNSRTRGTAPAATATAMTEAEHIAYHRAKTLRRLEGRESPEQGLPADDAGRDAAVQMLDEIHDRKSESAEMENDAYTGTADLEEYQSAMASPSGIYDPFTSSGDDQARRAELFLDGKFPVPVKHAPLSAKKVRSPVEVKKTAPLPRQQAAQLAASGAWGTPSSHVPAIGYSSVSPANTKAGSSKKSGQNSPSPSQKGTKYSLFPRDRIFSTPGRDEFECRRGDLKGFEGDDGPFGTAHGVQELREGRQRISNPDNNGNGAQVEEAKKAKKGCVGGKCVVM
ncbi:hypothetical protein P280DRAFT_511621 [Massarina eburnea CBS 473.64]|uniref:Pal1-domain-containing protein n=1 Tax=Massarina eburnea CBS 473.64 TaxID=1395130 RepID=A0A6A6RIP0_9PLEO|nr:hypothetical protein P280DRAFT_511621 [Massarina eburnea CBS 473.64]